MNNNLGQAYYYISQFETIPILAYTVRLSNNRYVSSLMVGMELQAEVLMSIKETAKKSFNKSTNIFSRRLSNRQFYDNPLGNYFTYCLSLLHQVWYLYYQRLLIAGQQPTTSCKFLSPVIQGSHVQFSRICVFGYKTEQVSL